MKTSTKIKLLVLAALVVLNATTSYSQTMTGTVLTQPCNNNGQIGVTVSGLIPPITFNYSNYNSNQFIVHPNINSTIDFLNNIPAFNNTPGANVWDVTAFDGTNSAFISLTITPAFNYSISVLPAVCPALSTIQATNFTGGTTPFTFAWTNTVTSTNYNTNPVAAPNGNYSLVVTDANGCKVSTGGTTGIVVNSNSGMTLNMAGTNANCTNGTATVTATGGTTPYSYLWSNGATTSAISNLMAGFYTCTVTAANGCQAVNFYNVIQAVNINININGLPANCTNGTATVTATGGTSPYSYLWNNGSVTQTRSGLMQGLLTCTITDVNGCRGQGSYYVPQAVNLIYNATINNATCLQTNGSITSFVSGGTAPYNYSWSNGSNSPNISNLLGGQNYTLQITDANGCTAYSVVPVAVNSPVNVTFSSTPSACNQSTGGATITASGGTGPYTYLWYTFPTNTTQNSITNKPIGNYSFRVTDALGCVKTGFVYIAPNTNLTANINSNSVACPLTMGNLSAIASGSNIPLSYLWNTGATTSTVNNIPLGAHTCTITDAAGCKLIKSAILSQFSPVNIGLNSTQATCLFSNNGSIVANATGGTSPYTYNWSNGQTGANASSLLTGYYSVLVTDANGCTKNGQAYVPYNATNFSCYCNITGTVFADANNNCIQNFGELGIGNILIHCSGLGYAYTNANGVYNFYAPSGTYTISEVVQPLYPLATCQASSSVVTVTAATNCTSTVNFANTVIPAHDLHVITSNWNFPIPGNQYQQRVVVQNEGTIVESAIKFGYTHGSQLTYSNCTPWALTQPNTVSAPNWFRINTGFQTLAPNASAGAFFNYNVPTNVPLGTVVNFYDTVAHALPLNTTWLTDYTPWNNVDNKQATVIGSYDPNFKEVSPAGVGPQGNISTNDTVLTYVIHFQNTGTYYAQNIEVVDTLDANLRMATLRPGYSTNKFTTKIDENGVVRFRFENINLPWKAQYGDVLSSGMFVYSIKLKKNLSIGTQIRNKAAIYFDYNSPIITNTTLNTIAIQSPNTTGLNSNLIKDANSLIIFPNPSKNYFDLICHSSIDEKGTLNIIDLNGRTISSMPVDLKAGENTFTENTLVLNPGIYFVQIKTSNISAVQKLIVDKSN